MCLDGACQIGLEPLLDKQQGIGSWPGFTEDPLPTISSHIIRIHGVSHGGNMKHIVAIALALYCGKVVATERGLAAVLACLAQSGGCGQAAAVWGLGIAWSFTIASPSIAGLAELVGVGLLRWSGCALGCFAKLDRGHMLNLTLRPHKAKRPGCMKRL